MATQEITDYTMHWNCHRCGSKIVATLITHNNRYKCAKCGTWFCFDIDVAPMRRVAKKATDWLNDFLNRIPKKDNRMTATKVIEQREAGIKRHADELSKAVDPGVEPTEFRGFSLKFEPIEPDPYSEATRKWLRDYEKAIAKAFNMPEAWIRVSINGDSLC